MIPQTPTPEQKQRAEDLNKRLWRRPKLPGDRPGMNGEAEAEKRFGGK